MKIASIVGARPQFVKLAPLSKELRKKHREIIIHTGQHYDPGLSAVFFKELSLPKPDYNLGVNSSETGRMLSKLEEVLEFEKPDWVLVFGDTNSTLAGALAASRLHLPLAHIEAGMRSYNNHMPEELNRKVTDHLSQLLFCATKVAVGNLKKEGITRGVNLVGDLMEEALGHNIKVAKRRSKFLQKLKLSPQEYYLVTLHRAENTDSKTRLKYLVDAIKQVKDKMVFPLHPRTKKRLQEFGLLANLEQMRNLRLLEPVAYLDMLVLEKNAKAVLTDSGGVQREAYFLGTPCLIMRTETEWTEKVGRGRNILWGRGDSNKIGGDLSLSPIRARKVSAPPVARRISKVLTQYGS